MSDKTPTTSKVGEENFSSFSEKRKIDIAKANENKIISANPLM